MVLPDQDERDRTIYVSGLDGRVTKELLYELFLQAGPLEHVAIIEKGVQSGTMKDEGDKSKKRGFAFSLVTFEDSESVPFTIAIMNGLELFGQPLNIKPREGSCHVKALKNAARTATRNAHQHQHQHQHRQQQQALFSEVPMLMNMLVPPPPPPPFSDSCLIFHQQNRNPSDPYRR